MCVQWRMKRNGVRLVLVISHGGKTMNKPFDMLA